MQIISNADKIRLASLIRYYRTKNYKATDSSDWSIASFPFDENGNAICSPWTLSQLESGTILKDDRIYHALLKKLSKSYDPTAQYSKDIRAFTVRMVYGQDAGDPKDFMAALRELHAHLLPCENTVPEEVYLEAIRLLLTFYDETYDLYGTLEPGRIMLIYELFDTYEEGLQACLQPVLHAYFAETDPKNLGGILHRLRFSDSVSMKSRLIYVNYRISHRHFFSVPILLKEIAAYYKKHPSAERELEVLESRVHFEILTRSADRKHALAELQQQFDKTEFDLQPGLIPKYLYNLGMFHWETGNIDAASDAYLRSLSYEGGHRARAAAYLLFFHTIYDRPIRKEALKIEDELSRFSEEISAGYASVFRYYRLKTKEEAPDTLESIIMDEILPFSKESGDQKMLEVFALELQSLVARTGHRKLLDKYRQSRH